MPQYNDEKRLVGYLLLRLEDRLAGRHETEIVRTQPADHCQLGVLVPWSREVDLEEQPEEPAEGGEEDGTRTSSSRSRGASASGQPAAAPTASGDDSEPPVPTESFSAREEASRRPPSSLGLAVALKPEGGTIRLKVRSRCVLYSRHFPDFPSQRAELGSGDPDAPGGRANVSLLDKFRRHVLQLPEVTFDLRPGQVASVTDGGILQEALNQFAAQLRVDTTTLRNFTGNRVVPRANLRDENTFQIFLDTLRGAPEVPDWRATIRLRARPTERGLRVEVHLCNESRRDMVRPSNDQYSSFYDTEVSIEIEQGVLVPIELLSFPADYQYDRNVYALGRNCGTEIAENRRLILTRSFASFEQPRLTTQERVIARFSELADQPFDILTRLHGAMTDYAADWSGRIIAQNALQLDQAQLAACQSDLDAFNLEIEGFAAGIAALNSDPNLTIAFRAMNRAFSTGRHPAWRMFQIVFIVSQLPSLAIREQITTAEWPIGTSHDWSEVLERADVLWFPTGGGKTEAYLGLVGCAALYDRLRGKHHGVTAWLRFPLRMLSVQQLQRSVKMIWSIELQRRELESTRGNLGDPFSLGYFVGNSNTPNRFSEQWSFERLETDDHQRNRLLLVPDCPACGRENTVEIELDRASHRVRHKCAQCEVELPVYVSDDEIYRFQPTLLVGTIDKIAAIGYQPKVASLWLGPQWRCPCPDHGYGSGDWCIQDCPTNRNSRVTPKPRRLDVVSYDPSPALHIQDELHLLQEELGAFAGHYETMVRANEAVASGNWAKVIAATATIAGYSHQVRQIYGVREVRRFPNRGYDLSQTFYSILEPQSTEPDANPKVARVFAAFRPPYLRPADAAARCIEILHETINRLQSDLSAARSEVGLPATMTEDDIRDLFAYYSRTLTYVGKRDSGVRVRQRLEQTSARAGSGLRPGETRDLNVDYLSAHSTLKEIATTIKKAEANTPWSAPDHLDATVATNVISHGVDVEYFNLMVLERIPEQVAEYIQVASRSGRQHVGLVPSILPRYSLRSNSIYDRFTEFHRHLDRMVMPVPVNRFAKAASGRSFPGVLLGTIYGKYFHTLPMDRSGCLRAVAQVIAGDPTLFSRQELNNALIRSFALGESRYNQSLENQMGESIQRCWDRFTLEVRQVSHHQLTDVFQPKPMSSLRDVDVPVPFRPDTDAMDYNELNWFHHTHD